MKVQLRMSLAKLCLMVMTVATLGTAVLLAQETGGTLTGTAKDPSGAVISGARGRHDARAVDAALDGLVAEGAKALLWDDEIGSLEVGKKADLVLYDLDHIEWTPFTDPLQALVY